MNTNTKGKKTHTEQQESSNPYGITLWELTALMRVSKDYWDNEVLTSNNWIQAREAMAIDSLLGSLEHKLRKHMGTEIPEGDWPLENEEQLKAMWNDDAGKL